MSSERNSSWVPFFNNHTVLHHEDDIHISNTLAGLITTVPLLAFALLSPLVPKLGQRFRVELIILIALILLIVGIVIRSLSEVNFFDNSFSDDVGNVLFGKGSSEQMSLMSPDNTSDGWLKKKWSILDGKRCLIKGGAARLNRSPTMK